VIAITLGPGAVPEHQVKPKSWSSEIPRNLKNRGASGTTDQELISLTLGLA